MVQILIIIAGFTYLAAQAQANTIIVNVGEGGLNYKPDSVTAVKGDTVEFVFAAQGNHSVAQSEGFTKPCHPMKNGFFSGYFPALTGPSNMSFALTINDTAPIWYYCSQGPHCTSGQVGVINPPANETIESFIANAKGDMVTDKPGPIMGGAVIAAVNSTSSGNSTSTGNSTTSGGSSTASGSSGSSGSPTSSGSSGSSGTGTATGSSASPTKNSAWAVDATAAGGVGGLVALFAALLL